MNKQTIKDTLFGAKNFLRVFVYCLTWHPYHQLHRQIGVFVCSYANETNVLKS